LQLPDYMTGNKEDDKIADTTEETEG